MNCRASHVRFSWRCCTPEGLGGRLELSPFNTRSPRRPATCLTAAINSRSRRHWGAEPLTIFWAGRRPRRCCRPFAFGPIRRRTPRRRSQTRRAKFWTERRREWEVLRRCSRGSFKRWAPGRRCFRRKVSRTARRGFRTSSHTERTSETGW